MAETIHERTGGNPLFVVSIADDLVRRGALVSAAGVGGRGRAPAWTMQSPTTFAA